MKYRTQIVRGAPGEAEVQMTQRLTQNDIEEGRFAAFMERHSGRVILEAVCSECQCQDQLVSDEVNHLVENAMTECTMNMCEPKEYVGPLTTALNKDPHLTMSSTRPCPGALRVVAVFGERIADSA